MSARYRFVRLTLVLALGVVALPRMSLAANATAQVQVTPAKSQTISERITAFGLVRPDPDHIADVTVLHAGLITRLLVRLGQRVTRGQTLLELDTAPSARVQYQQAQAAVDFARGNLSRLEKLLKQQLATRDQVDKARRSLRDAEAQLAAQRKLQTDRGKTIMRAPFDGIVTKLSVNQGQRVQADTTALLLARRDALVVLLGLEQNDAVRVREGQAVTLSSVFRSDVVIHAKVNAVHAMVNPKTRLVDVLVRIPAAGGNDLVLDESMRGSITLRQQRALVVPRSAVLRDANGNYVFVVRNGHAHKVAVSVGLDNDGVLAVKGQLKEGDVVVSLGNYELQDGMAVREVKQ